MSIQERLVEDLKLAMKSGDRLKTETIRLLRANLKDAEIAQMRKLSDEDAIKVLMSAAKKRKEAIEAYRAGGREDMAAKESQELQVISAYLPQQMTPTEIEAVIKLIITNTGAAGMKDLGKVMSEAMKELRGKADGNLVQQIVRNLLV